DPADERAAHGLGGAEPAPGTYGLEGVAGLLEKSARGFYADGRDILSRCHAHLAGEDPGEVARAHGYAAGQALDRVVLLWVLDHVGLQLAQRLVLGELHRELGAELRLPARALEEEDQLARGGERDVAAEVFFDQGERKVHARGYAGRGVEVAFLHEDRV